VNPDAAQPTARRPFWCKKGPARRTLRWCRRGGYVAGLAVVYAGVHLNQIGLPGFAKDALIGVLRDRGLEIEFSRMRVRLGRGIVAENVNVGRAREVAGEQVYVDQLQLKLDWARVIRFRPDISAVTLHGGRLVIPVSDTNGVAGRFEVDDIEGRLRFLGPELWDLEELRGTCLGGTFSAAGTVTNAGLLKRRSAPRDSESSPWRRVLLRTVVEAERSVFARPPSLSLAFHADLASRIRSTAEVRLTAVGAVTGFGSYENLALTAELNEPPSTNGAFTASVRLESGRASVLDGSVDGLRWDTSVELPPDGLVPSRIDWHLGANSLRWQGHRLDSIDVAGESLAAEATGLRFLPWDPTRTGSTTASPVFRSKVGLKISGLSLTNGISGGPASLKVDALHSESGWYEAGVVGSAATVSTPWAGTGPIRIDATLAPSDGHDVGLPDSGGWRFLTAVDFSATATATNVVRPDIAVDSANVKAGWSGGTLSLGSLDARLFGGRLEASGTVDSGTRRANLRCVSDADPAGALPLLREAGRRWMGQFEWSSNRPPRVSGALAATLPPWSGRPDSWRTNLQDSLVLDGAFSGVGFRFRGIGGDSATGTFTYSNRVWRIRDLRAVCPEGTVTMDYVGDERTKDFWYGVKSEIDPGIARPLVENPTASRYFGEFHFARPPVLDAEVWGRWHDPERIGFRAKVRATDMSFRGEHLDSVEGSLTYTNRFLAVSKAVLHDGTQVSEVDGFAYDIGAGLISFTNALSTFDPARVTRTIGPKTHRMMEGYVFPVPPTVRANGVMGIRGDPSRNDIRFDVQAAPKFHWWKLNANDVTASVQSLGPLLVVSNITAGFHGGRLTGNLEFDLEPGTPNTFRIDADVRDANLNTFVADLSTNPGHTNQLEGALTARMRITGGTTQDPLSWRGNGNARLRDGYLWDQPLFGALSTVMSGLSPGLGKARFSEGTATYTIAEGRVVTHDLQLRAPSMSLAFTGSVGFARDLDMVVQGSMFREVPLRGPVASLALSPFEKLFEYRLSGTLEKPRTEPAHIPGFLMIPLNPIGTILDLFPDTKKAPAVPEPPDNKPAPTAPPPPQN